MTLALTLPWAVLATVNGRMGNVGGLQRLTRNYRARLNAARLLVAAATRGHEPWACPLEVTITLYAPDRVRRDVDGYAKLILDAMSGTVYDDDFRVDDLRLRRGVVNRRNPRAEITVRAITQD